MIALLAGHGQRLLCIPGRTVHHASRAYRGDGKTDAKDVYVIADQARMRRDLQPLQEWDEIAVDLKILTARRYDLAADRTRAINCLRAQLLEYFPALERAFDYAASKAALILLTGYRTPAGLRRIGSSRLATWLKNRRVRGAEAIADAAIAAAQAQHTAVTGENTAAATCGPMVISAYCASSATSAESASSSPTRRAITSSMRVESGLRIPDTPAKYPCPASPASCTTRQAARKPARPSLHALQPPLTA